jgi:MFS family permease
MQNVAPVINQVSRGGTLRLAFSSAVVSLAAAFVAVGSTIPLFNIYRAEDGFTNAGISMTVVAYSAATLTTLLMTGRLSNHLGRRPTSIASLGLLVPGWPAPASPPPSSMPHRPGRPPSRRLVSAVDTALLSLASVRG